MVRYLTDTDVHRLLDMPRTLDLVERAWSDRSLGHAVDSPRTRLQTAAGMLNVLKATSTPWAISASSTTRLEAVRHDTYT